MSHILEFLDLMDVPNTYAGMPGKAVVVNATVDGVIFDDLAADFVVPTTTNFDSLLSSADDTLQKALDSIDDDALPRSEWAQNGFVDRSDVTIAWVDGTRTLTISPAVTSFQYYYAGVLYTEDGSLAATITDTEGLWAFYIGSGGAAALSTIHNPSYEQVEDAIREETIVAYVYWDATNNDGRLMDERHGSRMSPETHHYLHEIMKAKYNYGMTLGDILTDENGSADTHAQFSITAGRFYDEDIEHDTLARASTDTWECYYVNGAGDVRWVNCEATFPVAAVGGVIAWNSAGTLTPADNNKYILYHVFATNIHADDGGDYYPVVTPGIAQYGSLANAQDAAASEIQGIDFGDWPKEEIIPVATVIYKHLSSMSNGVEAAIQSTEGGGDFVDWRFTTISGSSTSVNDHGAMSGLFDDDHEQYLLASAATDRATFSTNWTDLTDGGATTLHTHAGGAGDLKADGTVPLTADWDAGGYEIRARTLESDVATGTAPFTIASTTAVTNLNADLLDGNEAAAFAASAHTHAAYLNKDGTVALTADWDAGAFEIRALTFESDVATGTAPMVVASITKVTNLNADLLDGLDSTAFVRANGTVALTADWDAGGYEIRARTLESDVATGTAPLTIASTTAVTNLNADMLDGNHATAFAAAAHGHTGMLLANGTVPLTADWDAGGYEIRARTLESDVATGTAPLTIASTTLVTNLNADMLDGIHNSAMLHNNVSGEIAALTHADPIFGDQFIFEDASASNAKRRVQLERITRFDLYGRGIFLWVSNDSGSAMAKGDLCYISGDASGIPRVTLADADAASTATKMLVMIYSTSINNGVDGWALAVGVVNGFTGLTAGAVMYVSTTAGDLTATAPSGTGDIVRIAGHAISSTEIYFNPSNAWVEIA